MRCIHCLKKITDKVTKDHVFPDSRIRIQHRTRYSAGRRRAVKIATTNLVNQEKELFLRLALTVDPLKIEASGIAEKAFRSVGIRAGNINKKEWLIREKKAENR